MKRVIAIDGPSGAGKSTVAKMIAKKLGYEYLDTGALYRAVGLGLRRLGIDEDASDRKLSSALKKIEARFRKGRVLLNGADVSKEIRTTEASHYASVFSARKPVRRHLLSLQRDAAEQADLVAEGRDMTTVVFPDAHAKFFLDASPQERARRRALELTAKGERADAAEVLREIVARDRRDSERQIAPLHRAADAHLIDSTGLTAKEVASRILAVVRDEKRRGRRGLEVVTARRAGFCFGVKRAMDITTEKSAKTKKGVYTLGPLIHNPQVIQRLRSHGVGHLEPEELSMHPVKTLIIRTHGIPRHLYDNISRRGLTIIDATCPFVKKAQDYARHLKENGYQVVILGDRRHPEVMGIMSYAGDDAVVVDDASPLPRLKPRVGVVVQTTQPIDALRKVLSDIVQQAREIKVFNTICSSTALRLKETEALARQVDVMIVVGGKNSANTTQLTNLCRSLAVPTYHIETAGEIDQRWFRTARTVGITAGASTPDWIIREVEYRIRDTGGESLHEH